MARKLEKIEKEMGYCEIKLEKQKRLRKQIEFLHADLEVLQGLLKFLRQNDLSLLDSPNRDFQERPSREAFLAAGLLNLVEEKRNLLEREREDLVGRLQHYDGFDGKRRLLESEKKDVLKNLPSTRSSKIRRINDEFKKIERNWNELTEDLINADEGIFFLERNLDYLRSGRNFLISAKGSFDFDNWRSEGYLTDLFRHSSIGRAMEMADGADRNLQLAQKELACISSFRVKMDSFIRVLVPVMEALFEDLFVNNRLQSTIQVVEAALAGNLKLLGHLKAKREALANKLEQTEKSRNQLFHKMGSGRRSEMPA